MLTTSADLQQRERLQAVEPHYQRGVSCHGGGLSMPSELVMFLWLISFQFLSFNDHGQGLSTAGNQMGLDDCRSSLIKEVWRIVDLFPKLCGAEVQQ